MFFRSKDPFPLGDSNTDFLCQKRNFYVFRNVLHSYQSYYSHMTTENNNKIMQ